MSDLLRVCSADVDRACANASDLFLVLGSTLILGVLAFSGGALSTLTASKAVVYTACAGNGTMRLINSGGSCRTGERLIWWNQAGQPSVVDAKGAVGVAGQQGAPGVAGDNGPTGSRSATG